MKFQDMRSARANIFEIDPLDIIVRRSRADDTGDVDVLWANVRTVREITACRLRQPLFFLLFETLKLDFVSNQSSENAANHRTGWPKRKPNSTTGEHPTESTVSRRPAIRKGPNVYRLPNTICSHVITSIMCTDISYNLIEPLVEISL